MKRERKVQIIFYNDPDNYPPIVNAVRLLSEAGWRVELLCRGGGKRWGVSYPNKVNVIRIDSRGRNSRREYVSFVASVLRYGSRGASLIYAHDMYALLPARLLATVHALPLVYHSHDFAQTTEDLSLGARVVNAFQYRFARTSDLVIVPDADRARVIARELRLKREPLVVANAPRKRLLVGGTALPQALAERGLHYERVIFRQGRIGVGHAIEATLRSLPSWASRSWAFVIMGIGDPSYLEKLNLEARTLGVEEQFVMLPPVGYDQVSAFTQAAHLGHALYEPIHINNVHITTASNKIMEYMEAGLPLLVSDTPALRALVENYKCGVAADEKSPESIASAVNILLGNSDRAQEMGRAARQAFEGEFCYDRQFACVMDSFQMLT